jgi:hypothetical protein
MSKDKCSKERSVLLPQKINRRTQPLDFPTVHSPSSGINFTAASRLQGSVALTV